ncbi:MAG: carbamoyl-phosphate synthase large subunit [Bacillota bacterium]
MEEAAKRLKDIRKVMVIGSGPIVIGQAAEFDYAGTQACKALKEEGLQVVLVNSNPATIMTDADMADQVYIEPLDTEILTRIIQKERPDGLLPSLGGQTGLNLAVKLAEAGILDAYNVRLLGTPVEAIKRAEDRDLFKKTMLEIGEPVPASAIVSELTAALEFVAQVGFPVIVRPAYTLGGTGGGIAHTPQQLREIVSRGLRASLIGQVLIELSVAGWKEIEFEVMRDAADNCIAICSMENFDPVGIHTGDSIVVAPAQTLSEPEFQMLRSAALKIIRALQVEGGCNIQFAMSPSSMQYYVIEVNPRVSRSSALASKATGYPIAKMAAKIGIGLTLDQIVNPVTGKTTACFEPTIDYVVLKIPRWPFDKFSTADRKLGTQMKATGEVMAIERNFAAALLKGLRSLEMGIYGLRLPHSHLWSDMEIEDKIRYPDDERLFALSEAFRRDWTVEEIYSLSGIDPWFLEKVKDLVLLETRIANGTLTGGLLREAKSSGFSDYQIAKLAGIKAKEVRERRKAEGIAPVYKLVDTCAAEFAAQTPYYYSAYEDENESCPGSLPKVLVVGSGPIRIGQGIEFDYCSVHSVWALREAGIESIIVNNNPETVSTDFDTSDKLYFEPLVLEDVLNIIDLEKPEGVILQFGGQTAINLAGPLAEEGVKVLGTPVKSIDVAEDRQKFEALLRSMGIPQSEGRSAVNQEEALAAATELGFPLLVRPSYVIGGRAMEVVHNLEDLMAYLQAAVQVSPKHPVLLDRYICGKEVEVDAISDGSDTLIPGIMEHIERAGVHSGDSLAVYPPQTLTGPEINQIVDYTQRIARALEVKGLLNIQFAVEKGRVYVLEANPRASRTVPVLSKVTGIPMVKLATWIMLGKTLKELGFGTGLCPATEYVAVKAPVFSFEKLSQVEISLGPEMKSTGEVMGIDKSFSGALHKALGASGLNLPAKGMVLVSLAEKDRQEAVPLVLQYLDLGFEVIATGETFNILRQAGIPARRVSLTEDGLAALVESIRGGAIALVINTPTRGKKPERQGFRLRRAAIEYRVPCLTSLDTAAALAQALRSARLGTDLDTKSLQEYLAEGSSRNRKTLWINNIAT